MENPEVSIEAKSARLDELVEELKDRWRHGEFTVEEIGVLLGEVKTLLEDLGTEVTKEKVSLMMSLMTDPRFVNLGFDNAREVYRLLVIHENAVGIYNPEHERRMKRTSGEG